MIYMILLRDMVVELSQSLGELFLFPLIHKLDSGQPGLTY